MKPWEVARLRLENDFSIHPEYRELALKLRNSPTLVCFLVDDGFQADFLMDHAAEIPNALVVAHTIDRARLTDEKVWESITRGIGASFIRALLKEEDK